MAFQGGGIVALCGDDVSDAVQKSGELLSLERAISRVESELGDSYVRHSEDLQRLRSVTADLKAERDLRGQTTRQAVEALQRADAAEKRCVELIDALTAAAQSLDVASRWANAPDGSDSPQCASELRPWLRSRAVAAQVALAGAVAKAALATVKEGG